MNEGHEEVNVRDKYQVDKRRLEAKGEQPKNR